jgi:general secretion pathway protein A
MYCKHYGFAEKPFNITPEPEFLYMTSGHREALATLLYGIRERRGIIAMVGDVGTGKTSLLWAAMQRLDKKTKAAYLFNSDMAFEDVLLLILDELGLLKPLEVLTKMEGLKRLTNYALHLYKKGSNLVLIMDEAQDFPRETLQGMRIISNLETNKYKVVQIVIAGQTELDRRLEDYGFRRFVQRLSLKRYIKPLSDKDIYAYLDHRLKVAKYNGPELFDRKAKQMIAAYSQGVPRKINIICDNALLSGYGAGKRKIMGRDIEEVVKDLG